MKFRQLWKALHGPTRISALAGEVGGEVGTQDRSAWCGPFLGCLSLIQSKKLLFVLTQTLKENSSAVPALYRRAHTCWVQSRARPCHRARPAPLLRPRAWRAQPGAQSLFSALLECGGPGGSSGQTGAKGPRGREEPAAPARLESCLRSTRTNTRAPAAARAAPSWPSIRTLPSPRGPAFLQGPWKGQEGSGEVAPTSPAPAGAP